jgi:uncharacterized membrane protein (DUF2068 family)
MASGGQVALGVQAVALAHGFFQVFGPVDLAVIEAADFKAEAVGAKIHSGQAGTVLHANGKGVAGQHSKQAVQPGVHALAVKHFHPMTRPSWVNMLCVT